MKTRVMACLTLLATAALVAPAAAAPQEGTDVGQGHQGTQLPKEDRDFFDDAAQGGLLEVKLGQLVIKQGASDEVKRFAQRMVDDHGKVNTKLADAGRQIGLSVPGDLDRKHQEKLDKMAQYSGTKLDQEYMNYMVSEHKDDVKAFEKQAKDGKDPILKSVAAGTLPTLNEHLNQARQIQDHLNKK